MTAARAVAVLALAAAALAGCNTVAGFGRDLSSAGHATTRAAEGAK